MHNILKMTRRSLLACLALASLTSAFAGADMSAPDALAGSQAAKLTLIDVRTPGEWKETGSPLGASRIDMNQPKGDAGFLEAVLKQTKGNKNTPVALICRTGNRSSKAQSFLESQGFTQVFNVREGMSGSGAGPGWLKRALPVQ
jgi:rhodanese-related sulfurtransferase